MPLQHDAQGFLTGNVINDIRRAVDALQAIKEGVSDIKTRLMAMQFPEPVVPRRNRSSALTDLIGPSLNAQGGRIEPVVPRRRDAHGRFISDQAQNNTRSSGDSTGPVRPAPLPRNETTPLILPDADIALPNGGRRRNRLDPQTERDSRGRFTSNTEQTDKQFQRTLFNGMGDRIATAVIDAQAGLENADPTIQAFHEIATPLKQGYQIFAGDSKDDNRWFRRIFSEIRLFRRDDTVFNRAANRSLRNLEGQEDENGNGGSQSFLGGLFGSISPWIMRGLASLGPMLLTGVTAVLGTVFGPVGLAVSAAGLAAWALFSEDGKKLFSRIGDDFMIGWNAITENLKTSWDGAVQVFTDVWEPIKKWFDDKLGIVSDTFNKAGNTVNNAVKGFTGFDIKASAKSAYSKASDFTKRNVIDPIATAKDWVLGKTSKWFESGKSGASTVSTGKGDKGGPSYGTYQLSSKEGTLQNFLKSTKYGATFGGLVPGSKEFNQRWKQVAEMDPDFGKAQHDFIKATHYDPQVQKLMNAGIDVSKRGSAVHDAIWSTSVQFGGDTELIKNALKGKDANKISEAEFVGAIQDYKIANNDQLFRSSAPKVRAGTLSRAAQEKDLLIGLANVSSRPPVQTAPINTVTLPSPKLPNIPAPPPIAESPGIKEPLGSGFDDRYVSLNVPQSEVGQNLSDRSIAHIVTGGIGAPV
jgi:hypothetical protein